MGISNGRTELLIKLAQIVERLGLPTVLIMIFLYGGWSVATKIVESHVNFLDATRELLVSQSGLLNAINDSELESLKNQTVIIRTLEGTHEQTKVLVQIRDGNDTINKTLQGQNERMAILDKTQTDLLKAQQDTVRKLEEIGKIIDKKM